MDILCIGIYIIYIHITLHMFVYIHIYIHTYVCIYINGNQEPECRRDEVLCNIDFLIRLFPLVYLQNTHLTAFCRPTEHYTYIPNHATAVLGQVDDEMLQSATVWSESRLFWVTLTAIPA